MKKQPLILMLILAVTLTACGDQNISGDAKLGLADSELETSSGLNIDLVEHSKFFSANDAVCDKLVAPIESRAGAKECLEELAKNNYFDSMKTVDFNVIIFKLVSLGATYDSAEWAVATNSHLFTDSFSDLETNNDGIFDTDVDSQCDDFGSGCGQCVFVDGDDVYSYQWCFQPCQTVVNIVYYVDGISSSYLYSHQGC